MVPEMDKIETCLLRKESASAGGSAGGRSEVRMDPIDAMIVSLWGQRVETVVTHWSYTQCEKDTE
jgi:hypothetical protein